MGVQPATWPVEVDAAVARVCGPLMAVTHIRSRGGSTVWRAEGEWLTAAVKLGYPAQPHTESPLLPAREAAVCEAMGELTAGHVLASGSTSDGSWLLTRWHHGDPTWDVWEDFRQDPTSSTARTQAIKASIALAETVAALHPASAVRGHTRVIADADLQVTGSAVFEVGSPGSKV